MFKLVKIENGRINVPEFSRAAADPAVSYREGCVYYLVSGSLATIYNDTNDLAFIPVESVSAGSGRTYVNGYYVSSGMVFEAEMTGEDEIVADGNTIGFTEDSDGTRYAVEAMFGEEVKLISKKDFKETGKVLVALKW